MPPSESTADELRAAIAAGGPLRTILHLCVRSAVERTGVNIFAAGRMLGLSPRSIYNHLQHAGTSVAALRAQHSFKAGRATAVAVAPATPAAASAPAPAAPPAALPGGEMATRVLFPSAVTNGILPYRSCSLSHCTEPAEANGRCHGHQSVVAAGVLQEAAQLTAEPVPAEPSSWPSLSLRQDEQDLEEIRAYLGLVSTVSLEPGEKLAAAAGLEVAAERLRAIAADWKRL